MIYRVIFKIIFLLLVNTITFSESYELIQIKINELNYSTHSNVFNEIKKIKNKVYIYCNKDKDFYKTAGEDGYLYKIVELDDKYSLVNEKILTNKIKFSSLGNYYYINNKGEIAFHNDSFEGETTSSVIDIFDLKDNLIKRIDTKVSIKYMAYYYDIDGYLYFVGVPSDQQDDGFFYIYKDEEENKKINYNDFEEPTYSPIFVYLLVSDKYLFGLYKRNLVIYNKIPFHNDKKINTLKQIDLSKYYYRQTNLMSYTRSNEGAKVRGNIFYQIKFLGNYEKEKTNNNCEIRGKMKSLQTLLIGVDVETEKQVKEIKINYSERYVSDAPNSYDIDDEGNIYILDSKSKNIIKIDKSVNKLEINYDTQNVSGGK